MRASDVVGCQFFPCIDVHHSGYRLPPVDIDPEQVRVILISESAAPDPDDDYYALGDPLFARTTILAFRDAGFSVHSIQEILNLGVYLTTAVKCSKMSYGIHRDTVCECSRLLERELELFPNAVAYLLMGDVAIQAINMIGRRHGVGRAIPAGPTYQIRDGVYTFRGVRLFPSFLQAGPSYFIEAGKRKMIAEDIAAALTYAQEVAMV